MDGLNSLMEALVAGFTLTQIFHVSWATLLGIFVGMLPGLTATMGVALLTTLTFHMDAQTAIVVLLSMYVGTIFGGSRSAILLNMPGTPASAASTLDGFPLAKAGQAREALGMATVGSFLGTLISVIILAVLAPILADYALQFGAFEFFWLAVFGIVISGRLTAFDDPLKGWIAGILGLLFAMVGQETLHAYPRFSFGSTELSGGINLIPAMVGTFGFAEILTVMASRNKEKVSSVSGKMLPPLSTFKKYWATIPRSGLAGTLVGIVPGVGEDIGAWVSYALAKRSSKEKEKYGKGSQEGLLSAETGNSAAVPGAIIPVLTLGVPGSAPAAVLMAAMIIHGIRPGPMIMIESPMVIYEVGVALLFAAIAILVFGLLLTKPMLKVLQVPATRLHPVIFVLCTVGSFALASRPFDILIMVVFGLLGFVLRQMKYPMAPIVLGLVLGSLLDQNMRRGLVLSDGSLEPFMTRPISAVLMVITLLTVLMGIPAVCRLFALAWRPKTN
ncbi:tripartite tricarboxylate transporter permease [Pseudovibrio sp. Tun.PSC04-5.I4]|uniref:tripartite tricarboxylate transporter permease n=1 Tax=Pseudovibrio sp. Tun.PSC04-5.I4 TaxID=1798213 RepID=UPI000881F5CD|nr:tripartite tricarboxylate transporter permease [Pseudovibrio sp. Tun.PSC04-5.I4]SDQ16990.1 putative tricarboxylic transport membrane protein [Pseudovibrio sp. Tun.PSC04-5.I4]